MAFDSYRLVRPVLHALAPERAHDLTIAALRAGLVAGKPQSKDPALAQAVWGLRFANPLGLAAGFDKNAMVVDPVLALGFGFAEIGTVTPRPRLFRLAEDEAVINRMGFNNDGVDAVRARLERRLARPRRKPGLVGANVGPNKGADDPIADCVACIRALAPLVDYLVINVSSPNTPGLRGLQAREALRPLLAAGLDARAGAARQPPLLVKVAPDLSAAERADIAAVVLDLGIDGLIATNTTLARPPDLHAAGRGETGGLSGRPLMAASTAVLADFYRLTEGRVPLIGVGGIAGGADAYAKIRAGAALVQLYTALVYRGPRLVGRILTELSARLRADGFATITEAVGADVRAESARSREAAHRG